MINLPMAEAALADLAAAWRGWEPQATGDAIIAAKQAGWDLGRIAAELVAQLRNDAPPTALRDAAANPFRRISGRPADGRTAAARAREMYPNLRRADTQGSAAV